jgi:hypothetical protein
MGNLVCFFPRWADFHFGAFGPEDKTTSSGLNGPREVKNTWDELGLLPTFALPEILACKS